MGYGNQRMETYLSNFELIYFIFLFCSHRGEFDRFIEQSGTKKPPGMSTSQSEKGFQFISF